jgi:hypothetical protein
MPESCLDRPTTSIEYIFLLTKNPKYYYDSEATKVAAKTTMKPRDKSNEGWHDGSGTNNCEKGERVWGDNQRRARRTSDWFFESFQGLLHNEEGEPLAMIVNPKPYKGAHFACFPPDLVRPCIQAGISEKGCCPSCGAGWKRVTKSTKSTREEGYALASGKGEHPQLFTRQTPSTETIGWEPFCSCSINEPTQPCVVLDPFGGSGTTAMVALELGAKAIVIELNSEYIPLIQQRCGIEPAPELAIA